MAKCIAEVNLLVPDTVMDEMDEKQGGFRRLPYLMLIVVLIAALYSAWMFYSRWNYVREQRKAAAAAEIERARRDVALNGGDALKVLTLYAAPAVLHRGQSAQLCYGVANATDVIFDPPVKEVWPSRSRCVDVAPAKTTTYVLTATGAGGRKETAQVEVQVK